MNDLIAHKGYTVPKHKEKVLCQYDGNFVYGIYVSTLQDPVWVINGDLVAPKDVIWYSNGPHKETP